MRQKASEAEKEERERIKRQILALLGKKRSEIPASWFPKELTRLRAKMTQLLAYLPAEERWKAIQEHDIENAPVVRPRRFGTILFYGRTPKRIGTKSERR